MTAPANTRPLTKTQLTYAMGRLEIALQVRLAKALESLPAAPVAPKSLTQEEKYKMISSGKAKLKKFEDVGHYFYNNYSYPVQEALVKAHQERMDKYTAEVTRLQKPVRAAYQMTMDTLVMGSAQEALDVVEKFASGK